MDRLLIAALLIANLAIIAYLCRLVIVVKRSLIHGTRDMDAEERVHALHEALKVAVAEVDRVARESSRALDERQRELLDLLASCERVLREAQEVLDSLAPTRAPGLAGSASAEPEAPPAQEPAALAEAPEAPPRELVARWRGFEKRHQRVLALSEEGLSMEAIAAEVDMSVGEVETVLCLERQFRGRDRGVAASAVSGSNLDS
ncbi:MAG TPA: hypothetical protein PLD23_20125 [Armatimonadota bacterium]|nr:hypothetical protein [Armatimonadota bacterium]HQK95817.1 hypothetical protein [Armatimonadota bacterium]